MLSKYRHPLSYVGARPKLFSRGGKLIPHFGRCELYSEWGRSPGGEEGVSYFHVRERQFVFSSSTTQPLSEHPRDEKPVRSVLEHDAHSERVLLGAPPRPRRGKQSAEHRSAGHKAIKARAGNRSARVAILTYRRCQGRENFSGRCPRNFSARFLDKTSVV